ncbi:amidohydrolase family protein [Patescibacteria group bacterium]
MYSVIIKNGAIIAGTGEPAHRSDIGISENKIVDIGEIRNNKADLILDAQGLYIAPGFIDLLTHSDIKGTLFSQPSQESFIRQGTTTILGGHDGYSLAPALNKKSVTLINNFLKNSDTTINKQTMEQLLKTINRAHPAVNFYTLVGFNMLIQNNISDDVSEITKNDASKIIELFENCLNEGAIGLSVNFETLNDNRILYYIVSKLVDVVAKRNLVTVYHLGNRKDKLLPHLSKIIMFTRNSGGRGHISHLRQSSCDNWGDFKKAIEMLEYAIHDEVELTCDYTLDTRLNPDEYINILSQKDFASLVTDETGFDMSQESSTKSELHNKNYKIFPSIFRQLVKENKTLSFEEAIYKITGLPAKILNLKNRGLIKVGNFADLVIFDPAQVKDELTHTIFPVQPVGIQYVFVNGELTFGENIFQGSRAGMVT